MINFFQHTNSKASPSTGNHAFYRSLYFKLWSFPETKTLCFQDRHNLIHLLLFATTMHRNTGRLGTHHPKDGCTSSIRFLTTDWWQIRDNPSFLFLFLLDLPSGKLKPLWSGLLHSTDLPFSKHNDKNHFENIRKPWTIIPWKSPTLTTPTAKRTCAARKAKLWANRVSCQWIWDASQVWRRCGCGSWWRRLLVIFFSVNVNGIWSWMLENKMNNRTIGCIGYTIQWYNQ